MTVGAVRHIGCAFSSWVAFDFNSQKRRLSRKICGSLRVLDGLDCVHRLRLYPLHTPNARTNRRAVARLVHQRAVSTVITNMRCTSSGVPVQEETRPAVVMHRLCCAWGRHGDFQHAHQCVFEDHLMTVRCGLDRVEPIGKAGSALRTGHAWANEERRESRAYRREELATVDRGNGPIYAHDFAPFH